MQAKRLFVIITVLLSLLLPNLSSAQQKQPKVVSIPDVNLAAAIRQEIGNQITTQTMLNLRNLDVPDRGITNLTGLEYAHNLERLKLGSEYTRDERRTYYMDHNSNIISDLTPIAGLTHLRTLHLVNTNISDISPLAKLTKLTVLYVGSNNISDISPLAKLTQLTQLSLFHNDISDISPLANLTKLTQLFLDFNNISDISALAKLTKLTQLFLDFNNITDISALAGLTELTVLDVGGNNISDISALAKLTKLTQLFLDLNNITDISALAGLTELTVLDVGHNNISDISPLAKLTKLESLYLRYNNISDISALAGLTELTSLDLRWYELNYASIYTHISAMQARGIEVKFNPRTPTTLVQILGTTQQGVVNAALPIPFVVEVRDERNRPFAGVLVTFAITAGSGKLNATTVATDTTGKASARLTMGRTVGPTTVRVTAAQISQPVQFTATATRPSAPVTIPDANLRAKITETLGKPLGETVTIPDMLKLTTFTANNADILDLTGLQHAANLTSLSLNNNNISNVAPLAGLTELMTLDLRNNRISDVSPLMGLTQSRGAKDWNALYLQGNPLSDTSIHTHIPLLQAAGVNVRFDRVLPQSRPMVVRIIYFLPRDRQPQPDIDVKLDRLIKEVQQFYADQMEAHGFGRKTFIFETDKHGNAVVYHVNGRLNDARYHYDSNIVWAEIGEQFDHSKNIYLTVLDVSTEKIGAGGWQICGIGIGSNHSGDALIPASGSCFDIDTAAHELGHAFGLQHDFRDESYIMSYGAPFSGWSTDRISQCAAEWLDAHRAFNSNSQAASNEHATIEMLSSSLVSPPNTIRLRFEVTDPDGLHQAQLLTDAIEEDPGQTGASKLLSCKSLNGKSSTVEFVTTLLTPKNESVSLAVIDKNGNFTIERDFPIDMTFLLPSPEVVSIPDPNLAAAIREEIGDSITTHTLLHLTRLDVDNRGITDLTGLQHARNLKELHLGAELIQGKGYVNSNTISDFTPIAGLSQLILLDLSETGISDVSVLANLTKLIRLDLSGNTISDVAPLANLTNLRNLHLNYNTISDISPLENLTKLTSLTLSFNNISGISPLANLTKLIRLDLSGNTISDVASLANLTKLTSLTLSGNTISDVASLANLTKLTSLDLSINTISDIAPLANLTKLTSLSLYSNTTISDASPLANLTKLTSLSLWGNTISDVAPLANLTKLRHLDLNFNNISDVAPLVKLNLTGTQWGGLYIRGNPLNYASINTHIPAMQAKGIEVKFDNRTHSALVKISGDTQEGEAGTKLPTPLVVEAIDRHGTPMAGLSVIFYVEAKDHFHAISGITTDTDGRAQATITLGPNPGVNKIRVTAAQLTDPVIFTATAPEASQPVADINGDGIVNIQDMVLVSSNFGKTEQNSADVNGDGVVNISDLVLVAGAFGEGAAAAPTLHLSDIEGLTAAEVQDLLTQARQMALTDPAYLRGIAVLEQLLARLLPKETVLLPNYPNPFNPETWIPYQLAEPAEVTLTIYGVDGRVVRRLALGHQAAGTYQSKSRAAYWDGRNAQGERVASGVYFYTFTADDFTATRKLLIRK